MTRSEQIKMEAILKDVQRIKTTLSKFKTTDKIKK